MPARFVILHHEISGGEHWDLMIEHGEVLSTWALAREPIDRSSLPLPARRIGDHRKAYLDFEGPISGGRGMVHRVDAGTVEFEQITTTRVLVYLRGDRLDGCFVLAADADGDEWTLDAL